MDIKYYDFHTSIGKMLIFFSSKGIVYLSVSNENEEDIVNFVKVKFGQASKVNSEEYSFHEQIIEYLNGRRKSFSLPLDLRGTDFQKKVWNELIKIPYGETRTYKDIARSINVPQGYRAVGNALNKNPVLIVVPCHRVIGSDGKLTGFRGGLELKAKLLELERS
jgi:methylated-DNA-[protein]-cysteine S-methyltransferase